MAITKTRGFVFILVSCLLAWLIANAGVRYEKLEMGAIANLFFPPLCGLASLLLFAVLDYFFKRRRVPVVVLLVLTNLCVGIAVRLVSETTR